MVDEGQSPTEVATEAGTTLGEVNSYLRAEMLYRLALLLDYDDDTRQKLTTPRFPLTTLERFLESKVGRNFLGIELDEAGGFRGVVHPERFNAVLARVVTDVIRPGFTRRINDEKGFNKYIAETGPKLPKTKQRGKFDPAALLSGTPQEMDADDTTPPDGHPPRKKRISVSVVPHGFVCDSKHDRIRTLFTELKQMKVVNHRNTTGVMLRVLIDVALWSFIKDQNLVNAACDHADPKKGRRKGNPDWTPALRDLVKYACEKRIFPGLAPDSYKSIRSLAAKDANYIATIDTFNSFTHSPTMTPTEGDLRALWQRAEPMLEIILR